VTGHVCDSGCFLDPRFVEFAAGHASETQAEALPVPLSPMRRRRIELANLLGREARRCA
jgi:hypothetical protein